MCTIQCLTLVIYSGGSYSRKVPDLYFKVADPKLQVADLKSEVRELRSGGIPQFNPWYHLRFSRIFSRASRR